MKTIYRVLAFIVGLAAIFGAAAAIKVAVLDKAKIEKYGTPVQAVVDSIEPQRPEGKKLYKMAVHYKSQEGSTESIEIRTYEFRSPGSTVTVIPDPKNPGEGIVQGESSAPSILFGAIIITIGIVMFVLAFSKRAHDLINRKLQKQSETRPVKNLATDSKWADAAFMMSLFNIVLIPALVTAPLSIILGIVAIFDMKNNQKTGKSKLVFTFVFSGLFIVGFILLAIFSA